MSRSHGPGQPLFARCWKCRGRDAGRHGSDVRAIRDAGHGDRMELTGRRRYRPNNNGGRVDVFYEYEYECRDCFHRGWTRHIDVARRWKP